MDLKKLRHMIKYIVRRALAGDTKFLKLLELRYVKNAPPRVIEEETGYCRSTVGWIKYKLLGSMTVREQEEAKKLLPRIIEEAKKIEPIAEIECCKATCKLCGRVFKTQCTVDALSTLIMHLEQNHASYIDKIVDRVIRRVIYERRYSPS